MAKKRSVKKVVEENVKKIPVGVQVISVLYYITAVLCAILGLLFIIGANAIVSFLVSYAPELASIITGGVLIALGVFFIALGILGFFIGRGLWKLKKWARILAIIFAILGVASAIYSMIASFGLGDIAKLVIHGAMGAYLIFSKEVSRAFQ